MSVDDIIRVMRNNVENAKKILIETTTNLSPDFPNSQENALKFSILTEKSKIPESTMDEMNLILGRHI